ncbi:hypothetical protein [Actinomadura welshii]|uniref:hypothetical protein n=1 Tax=Actinomadura welshii TaxID=3103817 RepID=UPI0003AD03D1|nr:hypothetical protein [Actinomadura madurae]
MPSTAVKHCRAPGCGPSFRTIGKSTGRRHVYDALIADQGRPRRRSGTGHALTSGVQHGTAVPPAASGPTGTVASRSRPRSAAIDDDALVVMPARSGGTADGDFSLTLRAYAVPAEIRHSLATIT